jgi:hypothetical protein
VTGEQHADTVRLQLSAMADSLRNQGTSRLSWWRRRGEQSLFLTYSRLPPLGAMIDLPGGDGRAVVTSVIRDRYDTATIFGFTLPTFEVRGKLVEP